MPTLEELRQRHPRLIYKSMNYELRDKNLYITWEFILEPNLEFHPQVIIKNIDQHYYSYLIIHNSNLLHNLIFHLGLMEIPTYWKATCSPQIVVEAGALNPDQRAWWHDLLLNGEGEFFYLNQIDFTTPNFVKILSTGPTISASQPDTELTLADTLIPLGGGKDSIVGLEILKQYHPEQIKIFTLNPTQAVKDIIQLNPDLPVIEVERKIDPQLLELNRQGYLNGHTPFSAYLAFLTTFVGVLFQIKDIALSNESSANECNVIYLGREINHQYSKTFDFETKFRHYVDQYLFSSQDHPNYFSLLRPWHELQIAQLFSRLAKPYYSIFRSCNRGQKTNTWCHQCSKCLFAFLMMFPFMDTAVLNEQVFQHNLFEDDNLIPTALQLVKEDETKPFECVGSKEESKIAFYLAIKKYQAADLELPKMLSTIKAEVLDLETDLEMRAERLLNDWNKFHQVPENLVSILREIRNQKHDN